MLRETARGRHSGTSGATVMHRRQAMAMAQAKGAFLAIALFCMCSALLTSLYVAHTVSVSQVGKEQDLPEGVAPGASGGNAGSAASHSAAGTGINASMHAASWGSRASAWQLPQGQQEISLAGEKPKPEAGVAGGGAGSQSGFLVVLSVNSSKLARLEESRLLWQARSLSTPLLRNIMPAWYSPTL